MVKQYEMSVGQTELDKSNEGRFSPSYITKCPPIPPLSTALALFLLAIFIYGTLVGSIGKDALVGGPVFGIYVLIIICYLGGHLAKLMKIPSLVGMMIFGFILRNVPYINVAEDIPELWAGNIRNIALIFILLRAGLEVDSLRYLVHRAMLSAVSPAVVLPVMLRMMKKGYGIASGIPTMVIAVAGIDDVLALTAFEVILGVTFATGALVWTVAQGPVEMLIGVVYGITVGMILWIVPNSEEKSKSVFRFILLVLAATCIFFGSQKLKAGAAGALGCICLPFTAAIHWKKKNCNDDENPVELALNFTWRFIEPLLFGLIGSEVRIDYLQAETIGRALTTLFAGLGSRMIGSMIAAYSAGFSVREQIFITVAGIPKATVQAAIGPTPLAMTRKLHLGAELEQYGIEILTIAVLAIFITAPIGAIAISVLAPNLLKVAPSNKFDEEKVQEITENTNVSSYGSIELDNINDNLFINTKGKNANM